MLVLDSLRSGYRPGSGSPRVVWFRAGTIEIALRGSANGNALFFAVDDEKSLRPEKLGELVFLEALVISVGM
jgi:hypothetical protein